MGVCVPLSPHPAWHWGKASGHLGLANKPTKEGPCPGMAWAPPASKEPPRGWCDGEGWHWDPLGWAVCSTQCQPVPCPGWAKTHPIFWVGMPRIPGRGVLGAVAVSPPSALGPGGSLSARIPPKMGSLGTRRWHRGGLPPAMGAAWHPGPFREVEEGEVPGGEQRHPRPPPFPGGEPRLGLVSSSGMLPPQWGAGGGRGGCAAISGCSFPLESPRPVEQRLLCAGAGLFLEPRPIFWL